MYVHFILENKNIKKIICEADEKKKKLCLESITTLCFKRQKKIITIHTKLYAHDGCIAFVYAYIRMNVIKLLYIHHICTSFANESLMIL